MESYEAVDDLNSLLGLMNENRSTSSSSGSYCRSNSTSSTRSSYGFQAFSEQEIQISHNYALESELRKIIVSHLEKQGKSRERAKKKIKEQYIKINQVHNSTGYVYVLKTLIQSTGRRPVYHPLHESFTKSLESLSLMNLEPPSDFVEGQTAVIKIPNTCEVRPCFACGGSGKECCKKCSKFTPNGIMCTWCYDRTLVPCNTCKSHKNLLHFISQVYKWDTKVSTYAHSPTSIISQDELVKATGYTLFQESNLLLSPLTESKVDFEEVIQFSRDAFKSISNLPENVAIVRQEQSVIAVEILLLEISYMGYSGSYAVFGEEKTVKTVIDVSPRWPGKLKVTLL